MTDMEKNELIPVREVVEQADVFYEKDDFEGAERFLEEWLKKAKEADDPFGELGILNELMGHYRKVGNCEKGLNAVYDGFELVERLEIDGSITAGTTWLNGATTMKAFGKSFEAITYYKKARRIYETRLSRTDYRISGLYNNMALCLCDLSRYAEAEALYTEALEILFSSAREDNICDAANTYMNLACLYEAWGKEGKIDKCLERCERALNFSRAAHDGYYAFTCKKCAPGFAHFGWFTAASELAKKADEIYKKKREEE